MSTTYGTTDLFSTITSGIASMFNDPQGAADYAQSLVGDDIDWEDIEFQSVADQITVEDAGESASANFNQSGASTSASSTPIVLYAGGALAAAAAYYLAKKR